MSIQGLGSGNVPPEGVGSSKQGAGTPPPTPPSKPDPASTEAYLTQLRSWVNNGGNAYFAKEPSSKSFALYYIDQLNDQASGSSPNLSQIIANTKTVITKPSATMEQTMTIMGQSLATFEGIDSALQTAMIHLNEANSQLTQIESYANNLKGQIANMKDGPEKTKAEADLATQETTITNYQNAIKSLSAEATSQISPFLQKFEGTWNSMLSDFDSYVKTPTNALYQKICTEHDSMPNWLTPEQTAFVQGDSASKTLGVNQVYYGLSGVENGLINVDREIHGGSAPTPTPWPSPSTKPTPPSSSQITNGTVIDFLRAVQQWLGLTSSTFIKANFTFLSNYVNNLVNQANSTYDKTSLENIITDVKNVVLSPSKAMENGIKIMTVFQKDYSNYEGTISGLVNRIPLLQTQIQQDLAAIAKFEKSLQGGKHPASAYNKFQAAKADLQKCQATLKSLQGQISYLKGLSSAASKINQEMMEDFQKLATGLKGKAGNDVVKEMRSLSSKVPSKLPPKAQKSLDTMNSLASSVTNDENNIVAGRKLMKKYPPPPKLPPGQMYIQSNELQGILAHGNTPAKMKAAIDAFLAKLKAENIDTLDLAFTQLNDIEALASGTKISGATPDTLVQWINNNPTAWKTFETEANSQGFKLDFSFGGQNAQAKDWALPAGQGAAMAQKLIQALTVNGKLMVTKFDFDVELQGFANGDMDNLKAFFTALHTGVKSSGGQVLLTSMGSVTDWVESKVGDKVTKGPLYDLFFNSDGSPAFSSMFDGLNLMMYSQTDYYLDPSNTQGDSVEDWINLIGKQNVGMIHLGFEDNVPYTHGHNPIWAPTNGQAAAMQYEALLSQLAKDGYIDNTHQLGGVFFWPDSNINPSADFPNQDFEKDFYTELNRWNWINR